MNAKGKGIFGRFRRKNAPTGTAFSGIDQRPYEPSFQADNTLLRSKTTPDAPTRQKHDSTDLFSLPTELHVQIVTQLQYQDLCSFRAVSTKARDLLAEGEVIHQWMLQNADRQQLKLYPSASDPTFRNLLNQQRRLRTATEFSTLLADYIEQKILRYTLLRRHEYPIWTKKGFLDTVKTLLAEGMVPLIVMVQHYLEHSARILLEATSASDTDYCATYRSQERLIFHSYEAEHLNLAHKFWMFLVWLSDQILHRPSYAGTFERTVRGWSMEPLNRFDYRLFLLFGNVDVLVRLLQADQPKQRRKIMDTWLARLDPDRDILWQQHWKETMKPSGNQISKQDVKKVLGLELSARDLWVESAEVVLIANDEPGLEENAPIGTPQQVMDFLCDLAGYDVLHLPPPPSMQ